VRSTWCARLIYLQIELVCRTGRRASQCSCIGRIRERDMSQFVHPHAGSDGYCRHLGGIDGPVTNYVATQYPESLSVRDQFAKTNLTSIDDRPRGRVETYNRRHGIMRFTSLRFREAHLGILWIREAAYRRHLLFYRKRR